MEILKVFLKVASQQAGVASKIIATTADLEALADGADRDLPALSGWRYEVFGKLALDAMEGRVGLALDKGEPTIIQLAAPDRAAEPSLRARIA